MDNPFAVEVAAARQRLARLKERLSHRAACRRSAASEPDPLAGRQPGNVAPLRDAGTHTSEVSSAIIAVCLADACMRLCSNAVGSYVQRSTALSGIRSASLRAALRARQLLVLRLSPCRHSFEAAKSHTGAGGAEAEADGAPQPSTLALQRLIVRHLLDSATSIPTDNARIRAQVLTTPRTTYVPAYKCRLLYVVNRGQC